MNHSIDSLIKKYYQEEISPEELAELRDSLSEMEDEKLKPSVEPLWEQTDELYLDSQKSERLYQSISARTGITYEGHSHAIVKKSLFSVLSLRWISAAAVFLLFMLGATYLYLHESSVVAPVLTAETEKNIIESEKGGHVATIVGLDHYELEKMKTAYPVTATQDQTKKKVSGAVKAMAANTDYGSWVTLSDQTRVRIGKGSTILAENTFKASQREVYLSGTAFFHVAKDRQHPFVVHTHTGDLKVYGTKFYVKSEPGERTIVVLIEGSLGATPSVGKEEMMVPGDMADMGKNFVILHRQIDTEPYALWAENKVSFKNWEDERIMNVVKLWYGHEVVYGSEVFKHLRCSGEIHREDSEETTLKKLEKATGMRVALDGGRIVFTLNSGAWGNSAKEK